MFFWIARQAKSKDAAVRKDAARKLGKGGRATGQGAVPASVALLLTLIKDSDVEVRAAAFESLGLVGDGRAIPEMVARLKDVDRLPEPGATGVREAAVRAFQGIGAAATPALLELTRDRSARLREAAVVALGGIETPEAEAALVAALQDARSSIRQVAVQALGRSAASGSLRMLQNALTHRDAATRRCAVEVLADVKSGEAAAALQPLTRDSNRGVREAAVRALAKQGSPEAIAALVRVFEAPDREMRQLASSALKGLDWQPATPDQRALRAILNGDYVAAAEEGPAATEPLAALLADKSPAVRRAVTAALGSTGHQAAVKPLLASLQDHDADVRASAVEALVRIGPPAVIPLASAAHESVRAAAPTIILGIGAPAAAPLVEMLERGEPYTHDGLGARRVSEDEEAEHAERAAHLLNRLLGQTAHDVDAHMRSRIAHLRNIVRVREVMAASRREEATMVVETVVDCKDLRDRAKQGS